MAKDKVKEEVNDQAVKAAMESGKPDPAGEGTGVVLRPTGGALTTIDYGTDAGAGMEDLRREEFRIPLIRIVQKGSPQCQPVAQGGVEGARTGMIMNTATGEMWAAGSGTVDMPMVFIPAHRDYNFVEYVPRDNGGGFVGIHDPDEKIIQEMRTKQGLFTKLTTPEGTEVVETFYLYGLLITSDGEVQEVVMPFVSKQIAKYQSLVARYKSIRYPDKEGVLKRPPIWAHRWLVSTKFEKNKKGDWYGWTLRMEKPKTIECRMDMDDPLYQQAKGLYELIKAGTAKADHAKAGADTATGDDPEIPF